MGRFFQNLKTLKIAGAGAPTSTQLQETGQSIFIEKKNQTDLGELILIQKAQILQHQNQTLPHPALSSISTTIIDDSGTPANVSPVPVDFEILQVGVLAIKNTSGGAAAVTLAITDGTTSIPLIVGLSVANGATVPIVSPLSYANATGSNFNEFNLDSSLYLIASSDAEVSILVGYRTLSVR